MFQIFDSRQFLTDIRIDYQVLKCSLEETGEPAPVNGSEIRHLYDYIERLESELKNAGIALPSEY